VRACFARTARTHTRHQALAHVCDQAGGRRHRLGGQAAAEVAALVGQQPQQAQQLQQLLVVLGALRLVMVVTYREPW
jgi:hypothetical protein